MPLPLGESVTGADAGPPEHRRLVGRRVALEPLDADAHAEPLWQAAHDGSDEAAVLWTYLPYGPFEDAAAMREWLRDAARSRDPSFFAVVRDDGPAGMTSFLNVDPPMRRLEIGHLWIAPRAQRSEANTEAVYLMLREAFDALGYRRVEWKCDALNERSRQAAVRLGFTFEGVSRQHMVVKGRNRDTAWYAMLDREWPSARRAFERWLDADPADRPTLASFRGTRP